LTDEGVASGWSGWTNQGLQAIFLATGDVKYSCENLAIFFNTLTSGRAFDSVINLFGTSRSVLLPKPDGSARPIGIGDALYRLFCRIIVNDVQEEVREKLSPRQFSVGTPGGSEIAARICQGFFDMPAMALLPLDIANAFNEMPRALMYTGAIRFCPRLCRTFRTFYGRPSDLRRTGGELVGQSCTGVKQGDGLGAIFFNLGVEIAVLSPMQTLLDALMTDFNDTNPNTPPLSAIVAFSDDTTIMAPIEVCEKISYELEALYAAANLRLAVHKCRFIGQALDDTYDSDRCRFTIGSGGSRVLGCPIGSSTYREKVIANDINEMIGRTFNNISSCRCTSCLHTHS